MFGTVLTTAYTLLLAYLLIRAASVPFLARRVRRRHLFVTGLILWSVFYLGRVFGHGGEGYAAAAMEFAGMTCLGTVFLSSLAMLTADLLTGFGFLFRRQAPALRGWALLAGAGLSAFALIQGLRPPAVVSWEVRLSGLPASLDGTVLVAVSDTHIGQLLGEAWLSKLLARIRAQRPDLVAFVGDIFEGHGGPAEEALRELSRLSAPMGVWFVSGNHEGYGPAANGEILGRAGFTRLDDRWEVVRPGLILAGVSDLTARGRRRQGGDPVGEALAGRPPGAVVFLSHTPLLAERAGEAGAGLMISGHTHGGQIWPFSLLVRSRYPLLAGRYEVNKMPVLVSRGAGTWGPRMRLWRRGEILRVTLKSDAGRSILLKGSDDDDQAFHAGGALHAVASVAVREAV